MNICKWCNNEVANDKTVWYRKNLLLGYSFCSTKCATQWKKSNNSNINNIVNSPTSAEELRRVQEENILLQEKHNQENLQTAKKVMAIIRELLPHWKIIVPLLLLLLATVFYLTMYGQILLYIYILLLGGAIWAYFTIPKD